MQKVKGKELEGKEIPVTVFRNNIWSLTVDFVGFKKHICIVVYVELT